jgi:protein-tyrosine-phosphatase
MARAPTAVLFACGLNRIRSPMAAELMRRLTAGHVFVDSVGLRVDPEALADPFVAAVMDEVGIDMAGHEPKTFEDLEDDSFDLIVSLTPEAQHRAVEFARNHDVALEYWPTLDPSLTAGSREQVLTAYRGVRDALDARLRSRFPAERSFGG